MLGLFLAAVSIYGLNEWKKIKQNADPKREQIIGLKAETYLMLQGRTRGFYFIVTFSAILGKLRLKQSQWRS